MFLSGEILSWSLGEPIVRGDTDRQVWQDWYDCYLAGRTQWHRQTSVAKIGVVEICQHRKKRSASIMENIALSNCTPFSEVVVHGTGSNVHYDTVFDLIAFAVGIALELHWLSYQRPEMCTAEFIGVPTRLPVPPVLLPSWLLTRCQVR